VRIIFLVIGQLAFCLQLWSLGSPSGPRSIFVYFESHRINVIFHGVITVLLVCYNISMIFLHNHICSLYICTREVSSYSVCFTITAVLLDWLILLYCIYVILSHVMTVTLLMLIFCHICCLFCSIHDSWTYLIFNDCFIYLLKCDSRWTFLLQSLC